MGLPPGKKPKKAKQAKTPKPKKDPKPKKPKKMKKSKKAAELGEPSETPQMGTDPGQTLQRGGARRDSADLGYPEGAPLHRGARSSTRQRSCANVQLHRLGDTDPLEGETPPLRWETELTPLGTDPGQGGRGNTTATRTGATTATTTPANSTTGAPATTKATDAAEESHAATNPRAQEVDTRGRDRPFLPAET